MTRAPVVIVGAGPVGLVSAILLADRGVPTVVLERAAEPSCLPRAVHLDDEAQRILQAAGVLDRLRPLLAPMSRYELRDARGRLLHAFVREREPLGQPASVLFHQPDLEAVLREAAEASPLVTLRWGHDAMRVDAGTGEVQVRGPGGVQQVVRGSAVLGCDGAASTVRRGLGVESVDRGADQAWLVVDLLVDRRPPGLEHPQQRCDPRRPATSVPVGPHRHRFEFMLTPGEGEEDVRERLPELVATWGVDLADVDVERAAVYRFHAVHARRWRHGRVFLLGDAAHQMPPFFGQGLCSGFRDAANLAWKLAMVWQGRARDDLLDTYEAERLPQVVETIRRTTLLGQVITGGGPIAGGLRRGGAAALRASPPLRRMVEGLRPPPLPAGPLVARTPGRARSGTAGHPLPGAELLGGDFALVGWRTDPLAGAHAATRRFWGALGARRLRVDPPGAAAVAGDEAHLEDPTGEVGRWFTRMRVDVAVVRPDLVVLGVGHAGDADRLEVLAARVARFT